MTEMTPGKTARWARLMNSCWDKTPCLDVKKQQDRASRALESDSENVVKKYSHQAGSSTGSAVGVLLASLSCLSSAGDGRSVEVGMSTAECLVGVVELLSFSLSSPVSDELCFRLPTLPLPPPHF